MTESERARNEGERFEAVEAAVRAIADGEMVVVTDDEDRENEGDLIMAASRASPAKLAFMIRHTSGILCTPIEQEHARKLRLQPMVHSNDAPLETAFTVSIDYRHGLTTGISAEERCNTVLALANSNAGPDDFVRPGHVFPLVAKPGGVLVRSGHTEAGVDLARLAGLPPIGVLAEIVNDDGSVKRMPELQAFAREHDLKMVSIADLIAYRQMREHLVERISEFTVETPVGPAHAITYRSRFESPEHLALLFGRAPATARPTTVRIHRERLLDDVFGSQSGHSRNLVTAALERIRAAGGGVFIYLRRADASLALPSDEDGEVTSEAVRQQQWREIGVGAQILRDLGIREIRVLAGRRHNYVGLRGFGLEIADSEPLDDASD